MTEIQVNDSQVSEQRVAATVHDRSYIVDGHTWEVREVIDVRTLEHSLVFMSAGVGRRVRQYPPNWRDLPGDALHAVSWSI